MLRGQLDELQHQADAEPERSSVKCMVMSIDGSRRSKAIPVRPRPPRRRHAGLPIPQGDDRANYQAAFDLLKDAKYPKRSTRSSSI